MNGRIKNILRRNIDVAGVFVFMLCVFSYIMFVLKWTGSDLCLHAEIAQKMLDEHRLFSTNFLMYFTVNLLTLFSGYKNLMRMVLILLISVSNTAKYVIVREAFKEWTSLKIAKLSSLSLIFVFVIPYVRYLWLIGIIPASEITHLGYYIGYYVPNVWHNSTILCMMPFAIACYLLSVKQFKEYSERRNIYITLLLALSVLVKPSFYFVYVIAYPIIILSKYGFKKESYHSLIPILVGGICLAYEYSTIYLFGINDGSSVVIEFTPLLALDFWKSQVWCLIASLSLPILFLFAYGKTIVWDREFWFVLIMLICGLGIQWYCKETGPRAHDGNFNWQTIASLWFVYYYMLKTMVTDRRRVSPLNRGGYSRYVVFAIYSIHVLMGIVYLVRYLLTQNYE